MVTKKFQDALNDHITSQLWSANLYLSMSFHFAFKGLDGFAHLMKHQAHKQQENAWKMAEYMVKRNWIPQVDKINVVPTGEGTPLEICEAMYKHECHMSDLIGKMVDMAAKEKEKATQDFLWGFVRQQVEEEGKAKKLVEKLRLAGDQGALMIDGMLMKKKYHPYHHPHPHGYDPHCDCKK